MQKYLLCALWLCCLAGCQGLRNEPTTFAQDADVLIESVDFWGRLHVAVYDRENNRLVSVGIFPRSWLPGRTLTIYDWDKRIEKNGSGTVRSSNSRAADLAFGFSHHRLDP